MTHLISRAPMSGDFHWREILSYLLFLLVEFFEWRERYRVLHEHLPPPLPFPQHVVVVSMPTFDDMFITKTSYLLPSFPPQINSKSKRLTGALWCQQRVACANLGTWIPT